MSKRLSVIVIAKNESGRIAQCLSSVQWADEVIVLDSGSEDDTVAIAKTFTPYVFETDWQGYGIQKQRALARATGDWVLNLDADEVVSEALKAEILAAMVLDAADGYRVPIQMVFYGKPLRFSGSPTRHVRLFKRANAAYTENIVHEKIQLPATARIGQLQQALLHHCYRDLSHAIDKLNRYSSYSAKSSVKHQGMFGVVGGAIWMFVRTYVLQRGFLDGRDGLVFAILRAHGSFYRGIKQLYPDCERQEALPASTRPSRRGLIKRLIGWVTVLSLSGCASPPPRDVNHICHIFKQYPSWYHAAQDVERRWQVPISVQMAIIHQESKFDANAQPPRTKLLWVVPWSRPSTAYGYSQALQSTWSLYRNSSGRFLASRDRFSDAVDFIGWYANIAHHRAGIARSDAFSLYLAYHEGVTGYLQKTYRHKGWLIPVAHKVSARAMLYQAQLAKCKF